MRILEGVSTSVQVGLLTASSVPFPSSQMAMKLGGLLARLSKMQHEPLQFATN